MTDTLTIRTYATAFKIAAIRRLEAGEGVWPLARELGISGKTLHEWLKSFGQQPTLDISTATMSELSARIRQLERAVVEKDSQIDVLKKAISIVSQPKTSASL